MLVHKKHRWYALWQTGKIAWPAEVRVVIGSWYLRSMKRRGFWKIQWRSILVWESSLNEVKMYVCIVAILLCYLLKCLMYSVKLELWFSWTIINYYIWKKLPFSLLMIWYLLTSPTREIICNLHQPHLLLQIAMVFQPWCNARKSRASSPHQEDWPLILMCLVMVLCYVVGFNVFCELDIVSLRTKHRFYGGNMSKPEELLSWAAWAVFWLVQI